MSIWSSLPSAQTDADVSECRGSVRDGAYSGLPGCEPGGERATVDHVVDGDTLRLDDGREIQLIGVDAPEAGTCAGDAATRHARARVEGRQVVLHAERGGRDRSLRPLLHVRYDGPDVEYPHRVLPTRLPRDRAAGSRSTRTATRPVPRARRRSAVASRDTGRRSTATTTAWPASERLIDEFLADIR